MKRTHLLAVFFITVTFSSFSQTYPLKLCSFNIQWLGSSKVRDDADLADLLKDQDIVVVQEVIAPPYAGTFPDGTPYKPAPRVAHFFDQMTNHGFSYALSEEDTGAGSTIHNNGSATELWVAFYKPQWIKIASNLPSGFLANDRSQNPDYDRVPYAFAFRTADRKLDFVLISVHLCPGSGLLDKQRRKHELGSIASWINGHNQTEKDFIILGDMNIENAAELGNATPAGFHSLNEHCLPTNTNVNGPKPFDHVMYNVAFTRNEIDQAFGFHPVNLIEAMRPRWKARTTSHYPGDPPYDHNKFRAHYSDHDPVQFRMAPLAGGDDD